MSRYADVLRPHGAVGGVVIAEVSTGSNSPASAVHTRVQGLDSMPDLPGLVEVGDTDVVEVPLDGIE